MVALAGVTVSAVRTAFVTVSEILPAGTAPKEALILTVPGDTACTTPLLAPTVATAGVFDVQVADSVRSWLEPSSKLPTALSCTLVSEASFDDVFGEMTEIEMRRAAVTVRLVLPVMLPCLAEMVVRPAPCPVARPFWLIVATAVFELAHRSTA